MRLSISNLAWGDLPVDEVAPKLRAAGMDGVEIAPTLVWPDAPDIDRHEVVRYGQQWRDHGLEISGIQSLLFGHPEFQLLDRSTWPAMRAHLEAMLTLGGALQADVAVFGSPRNRIRGALDTTAADDIAAEFLNSVVPVLAGNAVTLTLEPNAPAYGADYITHYQDSVALAQLVGSPWVRPQIDTGCLAMVGEDYAAAAAGHPPAHVHASAPQLALPPAGLDHEPLSEVLQSAGYQGWVVLEMLPAGDDHLFSALTGARWLAATYGRDQP